MYLRPLPTVMQCLSLLKNKTNISNIGIYTVHNKNKIKIWIKKLFNIKMFFAIKI